MDLFADEAAAQQQEQEEQRERSLQKAVLEIQKKFGKNAVLKGMNFEDGARTLERNKQIGGHKA
jgi:DNA polymerase V